jgi:hypothetical protein
MESSIAIWSQVIFFLSKSRRIILSDFALISCEPNPNKVRNSTWYTPVERHEAARFQDNIFAYGSISYVILSWQLFLEEENHENDEDDWEEDSCDFLIEILGFWMRGVDLARIFLFLEIAYCYTPFLRKLRCNQ